MLADMICKVGCAMIRYVVFGVMAIVAASYFMLGQTGASQEDLEKIASYKFTRHQAKIMHTCKREMAKRDLDFGSSQTLFGGCACVADNIRGRMSDRFYDLANDVVQASFTKRPGLLLLSNLKVHVKKLKRQHVSWNEIKRSGKVVERSIRNCGHNLKLAKFDRRDMWKFKLIGR